MKKFFFTTFVALTTLSAIFSPFSLTAQKNSHDAVAALIEQTEHKFQVVPWEQSEYAVVDSMWTQQIGLDGWMISRGNNLTDSMAALYSISKKQSESFVQLILQPNERISFWLGSHEALDFFYQNRVWKIPAKVKLSKTQRDALKQLQEFFESQKIESYIAPYDSTLDRCPTNRQAIKPIFQKLPGAYVINGTKIPLDGGFLPVDTNEIANILEGVEGIGDPSEPNWLSEYQNAVFQKMEQGGWLPKRNMFNIIFIRKGSNPQAEGYLVLPLNVNSPKKTLGMKIVKVK